MISTQKKQKGRLNKMRRPFYYKCHSNYINKQLRHRNCQQQICLIVGMDASKDKVHSEIGDGNTENCQNTIDVE